MVMLSYNHMYTVYAKCNSVIGWVKVVLRYAPYMRTYEHTYCEMCSRQLSLIWTIRCVYVPSTCLASVSTDMHAVRSWEWPGIRTVDSLCVCCKVHVCMSCTTCTRITWCVYWLLFDVVYNLYCTHAYVTSTTLLWCVINCPITFYHRSNQEALDVGGSDGCAGDRAHHSARCVRGRGKGRVRQVL